MMNTLNNNCRLAYYSCRRISIVLCAILFAFFASAAIAEPAIVLYNGLAFKTPDDCYRYLNQFESTVKKHDTFVVVERKHVRGMRGRTLDGAGALPGYTVEFREWVSRTEKTKHELRYLKSKWLESERAIKVKKGLKVDLSMRDIPDKSGWDPKQPSYHEIHDKDFHGKTTVRRVMIGEEYYYIPEYIVARTAKQP